MAQIVTMPDGARHEFPDEATPEMISQALGLGPKPEPQPERSIGMQALRAGEFASRGFMDKTAETLGAVPDLVARGMRAVGLPAPGPGFYTDKIKSGMDALGRTISAPVNAVLPEFGPNAPENAVERGAYGAGGGAADAASVFLPAAAVARSAQAGSLTQRTAQALSAQPVAQTAAGVAGGGVGEATDNPLYGLAAALAVPAGAAGLRRAASPVANQLTPEQHRLAQIAQQEGINLTAGQRTGSRPLQALESTFATLPGTAGPQQAINQTQRQQFNRAALGRAGINADSATPDVLAAAQRRLGNEFQHLSASTTVDLNDQQFLRDLADTTARYANKLPSQMREVFEAYVNDITALGATMPGPTYQVTRSDLTRQAKAYANSDPALSNALRGLRDALDDAADRAIPPHLRDQWTEARREYANLKTVERAMSNSTTGAAAGDISPTQLSMAVRQQNPRAFARGAGELNDLARVGTTFVRDNVPNSGTPERNMLIQLLTGGGLNAGGIAAGVDPLTSTAASTAAALGGPRLAQALYNTPAVQAYLTNQVAQGVGPRADRALLAALLAARAKEPATQAITAP